MRSIEISHRTIIFTVTVVGLIWLLIQISSIILGLFVALLLTTALNPIVDKISSFRLPRLLAILIAYILLFGVVAAALFGLIPPLVDETNKLIDRLPELLDQAGSWLIGIGVTGVDGGLIADQISKLGAISGNILKIVTGIFSNLIAVITVLVVTFYMLLERRNLDKYLVVLFGTNAESRAKNFVDTLEARLGGWVRGEALLMVTIGILTYIGLTILQIPFALPLAILAGVLEIIPNIGPVISSIPALIVGFTLSPIMGLAVAALYFLVQQLENSIIAPKIMQKVAGVNPLVTIIALAVGFKLAGALGAILAVPVVIVLQVVAIDILGLRVLQKI